jgi:autotransporter-associated beta strand protein
MGGAGATSATWTGNTSTAWTLGTNWLGGTEPDASGDVATISGTPNKTTMALGASAITVGNISFNTASTMTISGAGGLIFQNTGTGATGMDLSNSGTLKITGAVTLDDDLYIVNNGSAANTLTLSGGVTTSATSNITLSGSGSTTFSGTAISGAGSVTMNGSGDVTVSVASTYTGNTTVNSGFFEGGGTLTTPNLFINGGNFDYTKSNLLSDTTNVTVAGGNYNLDTFKDTIANLTMTSGTVSGTGTLTIANPGTFALSGGEVDVILAGTGNLSMNGAGNTVTLTGANTYTGVTSITAGTLSVGTLAAGGTASGIGKATAAASNLIIDGGTLQYTGGTVSTNRQFTMGAGGATLDASGTGAVTYSNTTMALTGNGARTLTLTGSNTSTNTLAAAVVDEDAGNITSLTKSGTGEWVLTGNNTFTGTATVSSGTLKLAAATGYALGNVSSVVINSGGTLLLGAANQINGTATSGVAANMTLAGGTFNTGGFGQASGTLGTLTMTANSTIDLGTSASVIHYDVSSAEGWSGELQVLNWNGTIAGTGGGTDQLIFGSSTAGLTSGQVNQIEFINPNGVTGIYNAEILSSGEVIAFKPIPEPGTVAAGAALTGLAGWWEWRRRRARIRRA